MTYLKPCPFCGQEETEIINDERRLAVRCGYCGATGEECSTEKQAIEAWNKRVETELEQKYKWQVVDTCKRAEKAEKRIELLIKAARLIHKRGWMVSGSLEMAECDALCKEAGLEVWTWKDMPATGDSG
jgi:Lar family restriction alleviation protein